MISVSLGRDERNVIVGSPTYLAGRALPIAPTDLAKHDCIRMRLPDGAVYRWEFERDGEQLLVDVSGRLTLNDVGLIRPWRDAGLRTYPSGRWPTTCTKGAWFTCWRIGPHRSLGLPLLPWSPPRTGWPARFHRPHTGATATPRRLKVRLDPRRLRPYSASKRRRASHFAPVNQIANHADQL
jgi:LysR substrate binding domain